MHPVHYFMWFLVFSFFYGVSYLREDGKFIALLFVYQFRLPIGFSVVVLSAMLHDVYGYFGGAAQSISSEVVSYSQVTSVRTLSSLISTVQVDTTINPPRTKTLAPGFSVETFTFVTSLPVTTSWYTEPLGITTAVPVIPSGSSQSSSTIAIAATDSVSPANVTFLNGTSLPTVTGLPEEKQQSSTGVIIGSVIGGLFGLILIGLLGFFVYKKVQKYRHKDDLPWDHAEHRDVRSKTIVHLGPVNPHSLMTSQLYGLNPTSAQRNSAGEGPSRVNSPPPPPRPARPASIDMSDFHDFGMVIGPQLNRQGPSKRVNNSVVGSVSSSSTRVNTFGSGSFSGSTAIAQGQRNGTNEYGNSTSENRSFTLSPAFEEEDVFTSSTIQPGPESTATTTADSNVPYLLMRHEDEDETDLAVRDMHRARALARLESPWTPAKPTTARIESIFGNNRVRFGGPGADGLGAALPDLGSGATTAGGESTASTTPGQFTYQIATAADMEAIERAAERTRQRNAEFDAARRMRLEKEKKEKKL